MTSRHIKILIIEDDYATRLLLRMVLEQSNLIVGEAETAQVGIELAINLHPEVIIMDFALPGMNGLEATSALKSISKSFRVLMLTSRDDEHFILSAFNAGVDGYCLKDAQPEQLLSAVDAVSLGAGWLDPLIAEQILHSSSAGGSSSNNKEQLSRESKRMSAEHFLLTSREIQVLDFIVAGLSNQKIADKLELSLQTVKVHVRHILEKLMVSDRTQAAVKALKLGLVKSSED
ncbi:MAG: response regulator transcription factor [Cyanobacteria bacterium SZAS-4]|nr:response regulator transcription factor [Cyanobacteria bacterium SZAS-4]